MPNRLGAFPARHDPYLSRRDAPWQGDQGAEVQEVKNMSGSPSRGVDRFRLTGENVFDLLFVRLAGGLNGWF